MGEAPAERPPVSHLQVSDVAGAVGDCGERCQSQLDRACELVPRREGTDVELAVETHASEIEASDVDQDARPNDPQLQDRKERLPARERLRIGIGEAASASSSDAALMCSTAAGSRRGCRPDRVHDRLVAGTAAEVALRARVTCLIVGMWSLKGGRVP